KHRIDATRNSCTRERFDVFRLSTRCMTQPARQLQRMRHVKNYRHAKLAHDWKRAHVDHQIVITKTRAPFREQKLLTPNLARFIDDVARVLRREKLAFLDVDRLPGSRRSDDQICLP